MIDKYDEIIQEQLKEGIVERVVEEPSERVFLHLAQTCEKGSSNNDTT